ncbi:hypothetical protein BD324DRAFT_650003 [Kockovaella imperatae]|uniref:Glycopeptide n=1 Tax=Kockovaella imperatae TaxID=4999 RepID=A0A1Y1UMD7_9TREE|nr:hypothetical protein BD324DRAFT_650003 [Kockovaella imperatae]ORX38654.1 hypothetical protein BD324DRAFT_650003 [Kockovaella imperatae]
MFANIIAVAAFGALAAIASPTPEKRGEYHTVTLINNCGVGTAAFEVAGGKMYYGTTTLDGPVEGGLAWITGAYGCGDANGLNCGDVEFTLVNPTSSNGYAQTAADYSLQQNSGQTHSYKYPMDFRFDGCNPTPYTPGECTGPTQSDCPGAFVGTDATDGTVFQCSNDNVGITITFC